MSEAEPYRVQHSGVERFFLYLAIFLLGAIVMGFEMLASRYLNPFFGSSIYTWGSLIAVVLAGMTFGYFFGGRLADRSPSPATFAAVIVPAPILLALLPTFAEPIALSFAEIDADVRIGVLAASMALFFLPVMLLSAASPFAIRLMLSSRERGGRVAGTVFAVSTTGSIVGTLGTVFWLIPNFGTRTITYALAAAAAGTIFVILAPRLIRGKATPVVAAVALCVVGTLAVLPHSADAASVRDLRENLIEEKDTPYNQIYIFRSGNYVTMKFGLRERRFTESVSNYRNPRELPVLYTRALTLGAACSAQANKVLMVGLGGGSTIRYMAQYMPQTSFTSVEIDPGVVELARKYFDVKVTPQQQIVIKDGRLFLHGTQDRYDIIFVDAYRGAFVPFHLTTQEFYRLARSRLTPGGCVVQNVDPSTLLFDATMATMRSVFANLETVQAGGNVVVIGYDGPKRDLGVWRQRAEAAQARYKFHYALPALVDDMQAVDWNRNTRPLTDDFAPAEILNMEDRH
jgi:spermidine synthase